MRKFRTTTKLLAIGVVAVLATLLARPPPPAPPRSRARSRSRCGSATSRTSPTRRRIVGVAERHLRQGARHERHARAAARSTPAPRRVQALLAERARRLASSAPTRRSTPCRSRKGVIRIVSGAASGGAYFVVKPDDQQRRRPQGQEDRHAAARQHAGRRAAHLAEDEGPRHRHHRRRRRHDRARRTTPTRSPRSRPGDIDGAWVPEPWATRLVNEGGGKMLVDEADLWPEGKFVTTQLDRHHEVPRRPTPTS